ARKAREIHPHTTLAGWLIATTRLISRDMMRREMRRKRHERQAGEAADDAARATTPADEKARLWLDIHPLVDDALARLDEPERSAVAMRYFQGCSIEEVAAALEISAAAAQKRISRAIERLRESFARRGVVLAAEPLAAA